MTNGGFYSAAHLKSVFTFGADYEVLAFGFRQSQDGFAVVAFTVHVSFTVTEFVSAKLKKITKGFVFLSSRRNISRENSEKHPARHSGYANVI